MPEPMEIHAKQAGTPFEFAVCTELLPAIRERYQSSFDLLEIPEVIGYDKQFGPHGLVAFRDYDGKKYDDLWSERQEHQALGGRALGTELCSDMDRLINDFRRIDLDWLCEHRVGSQAWDSRFSIGRWIDSLRASRAAAIGIGISEEELRRTEEFVGEGFAFTDQIICNGDFYPRNLIRLEHRVVVVDWGSWNGYRVCFVDYLVNFAAFAVLHMWNNEEWQRKFLSLVRNRFGAAPRDLRKALVVKSFEQALFWKAHPWLVPPQVSLFRSALNDALTITT
jgi:hypothetical protein